MKTKVCSNPECGEHPIDEFPLINNGPRRGAQCRSCLQKKAKGRYVKPKIRKVRRIDSDLANDYTSMKW